MSGLALERTGVAVLVHGASRAAWAALGLLATVTCCVVASPWLLLAWLVPDLGVLAGGMRLVDERGQLTRRAALGYNATHSLVGPALLGAVALLLGSPFLGGLLALWVSHIGIDRALGYTLKTVPVADA